MIIWSPDLCAIRSASGPYKTVFRDKQSLCWMNQTCILDVFFIILALRSQLQQYSVCYCCDYCKIYFCFNPSMYFLLDDCISYYFNVISDNNSAQGSHICLFQYSSTFSVSIIHCISTLVTLTFVNQENSSG